MSGDLDLDGRNERGRAYYAGHFGVDAREIDGVLADLVGSKMATELLSAAGGHAWEGSALTARERSLVVVACLVTLGGVEARMASHIRSALKQGMSFEALESAIVLLTNYAGQPRASVAMELLRKEAAADSERRAPQTIRSE